MPLSDHQLASREPLPEPTGEDWVSWAQRLIVVLDSEFITMTQAAAILPIIDSSGRTIIDLDGIYGYDALGANPIAPDIVSIDTQQLVDAAIITSKLANLSVETTKIALLAVGTAQMANLAVTSAIIGNLAVVTGKIDNLAVNEAKIANLAVTSAKIALLAVDRAQIANTIESDDWNNTTKLGIKLHFDTGLIEGQAIAIYDSSGNLLFSSGGADYWTSLTNKPKDTFNLWADPQFELGVTALESLNAAHELVLDPLSKFNGAIQLSGVSGNKKSILVTIPASAGQTIFTEWYAHKDGSVNPGADVGLTFRWVDGADDQISQTTDLQDESAMSTGAWTKFTGSSIAPANTASVGLRVENRTSHTAGNFFLSMVSFRSAYPALWDDVSGAAKPDDNAEVNPADLAALDSPQDTKLNGIETGADVTAANPQDGSWLTDGGIFVTAGQINSGNISTFIANVAILQAQIANLAVGTAQIAALAVTEAKIANLAVTNAKIDNLDAEKITTGLLKADRIQIDNITLDTDGGSPPKLIIKVGGITSVLLTDDTLTVGKCAVGSWNIDQTENDPTLFTNIAQNPSWETFSVTAAVIKDSHAFLVTAKVDHSTNTTDAFNNVAVAELQEQIDSGGWSTIATLPMFAHGSSFTTKVIASNLDRSPQADGSFEYRIRVQRDAGEAIISNCKNANVVIDGAFNK